MSTVTKIFTVLLVVFSIAFSMVNISFVAQTNDWRSLAKGYQTEAQTADTYLRNTLAASAAQASLDRDAINSHIAQIGELEATNQQLQREMADVKSQVAQSQSDNNVLQSTIRTLSGELKIGQAGWTEQYKQRESLEARNIELEKRNLDLNERLNELTAQVLVFRQNVRQLEQKVHLLEGEGGQAGRRPSGESVVAGGPSLDTVSPITPIAESPIRGEVTELRGNLATISVGSSDGVAEGMLFVIYRGFDYVCDLKISKVEPNLAAGVILNASTDPRIGDSVADQSRFGFANN